MARLAEIPGLDRAATDRSGTLLRLRAQDDGAIASARAALGVLGHDTAEFLAGEERALLLSATEWYDGARLHELSREEAALLAEEATSAFEPASALTRSERERLRSDAEDALFASRRRRTASGACGSSGRCRASSSALMGTSAKSAPLSSQLCCAHGATRGGGGRGWRTSST